MSDRRGSGSHDEERRRAESPLRQELWEQSEAALEVITPELWKMAMAAGTLLDVTPDPSRPLPHRVLRKPQVAGEVAVVLQIEARTDEPPVTLADLRCSVRRRWSFPRGWFGRTRPPVWRDLTVYDVRDLSSPTVHLIEDLRVVVASGLRTRATDAS
jgi:hypothetical protein